MILIKEYCDKKRTLVWMPLAYPRYQVSRFHTMQSEKRTSLYDESLPDPFSSKRVRVQQCQYSPNSRLSLYTPKSVGSQGEKRCLLVLPILPSLQQNRCLLLGGETALGDVKSLLTSTDLTFFKTRMLPLGDRVGFPRRVIPNTSACLEADARVQLSTSGFTIITGQSIQAKSQHEG